MHDQHYRVSSYRLSDKTKDNLKILYKKTRLSYNLLFAEMIKIYMKKINNKQKKIIEEEIDDGIF